MGRGPDPAAVVWSVVGLAAKLAANALAAVWIGGMAAHVLGAVQAVWGLSPSAGPLPLPAAGGPLAGVLAHPVAAMGAALGRFPR